MTDASSMAKSKAALAAAWQAAAAIEAPLNAQIDAYVAAQRGIIPETLAAYDRMVERLERAGAGGEAPAVGDVMPEALLPDASGRLVALSSLYADGALVVSFNRGHWCPYCRLELLALKKAAGVLGRRGVRLVSIVPETSVYSVRMIEMNGLDFPVLSDLDHGFALEMALAVWTGPELASLYAGRGIDLARFQGNDSWMLPIPATYVVGGDGRIRTRFVDPEFRRRMPIEDIVSLVSAGGPDCP